jgi:nitrite reductase/ring-hydroxylating ferredoxin subunit
MACPRCLLLRDAGGPLDCGDIEDSHGRLCVVCPWHKHTITLDTGESLYTSINPSNPREKKYNCSKGVKQRVHHVRIDGDNVCLRLSDLSKQVESDRYFTEQYKAFIEGVLEQPVLQKPPPRYPIHSTRKGLK